MKRWTLAVAALVVGASDVEASANSISFGGAWNYANGGGVPSPAMASGLNGEIATSLEVHQGYSPALWTSFVGAQQVQYTTGFAPAIAVDSETANMVEVHQGQSGFGSLWYSLGTASNAGRGTPPVWNVENAFDNGLRPSVAAKVADQGLGRPAVVVEVHEGTGGSLWMSVGVPTNPFGTWGNVNWMRSANYATGNYPSIAVTGGKQVSTGYQYTLLEAHGSQDFCSGSVCAIYAQTYLVTVTSTGWSGSTVSSTLVGFGSSPSVAICDGLQNTLNTFPSETAVEVHQGSASDMIADFTGIEEWTGILRSNPISGQGGWNTYGKYGSGYLPKIACALRSGIEVHQGTAASTGPLWTSTFSSDD